MDAQQQAPSPPSIQGYTEIEYDNKLQNYFTSFKLEVELSVVRVHFIST